MKKISNDFLFIDVCITVLIWFNRGYLSKGELRNVFFLKKTFFFLMFVIAGSQRLLGPEGCLEQEFYSSCSIVFYFGEEI